MHAFPAGVHDEDFRGKKACFLTAGKPAFLYLAGGRFSFFRKKKRPNDLPLRAFFLFRVVPADEKEFIPIVVKNVYSPAITSFPFVITGEIMSQIADKATSE